MTPQHKSFLENLCSSISVSCGFTGSHAVTSRFSFQKAACEQQNGANAWEVLYSKTDSILLRTDSIFLRTARPWVALMHPLTTRLDHSWNFYFKWRIYSIAANMKYVLQASHQKQLLQGFTFPFWIPVIILSCRLTTSPQWQDTGVDKNLRIQFWVNQCKLFSNFVFFQG